VGAWSRVLYGVKVGRIRSPMRGVEDGDAAFCKNYLTICFQGVLTDIVLVTATGNVF